MGPGGPHGLQTRLAGCLRSPWWVRLPLAPAKNNSSRPYHYTMDQVTVRFDSEGPFRPSEIVADLRNVAEALFHPLRLVAYWDTQAQGRHTCPQTDRGEECPHLRSPDSLGYADYADTVDRELEGSLEVYFPHARVSIYLGSPATLVSAFNTRIPSKGR